MKPSLAWSIVGVFFAGLLVVGAFSLAPSHFPEGTIAVIEKGMTLRQAADELKSEGIVKSSTIFHIYARLLGGSRGIKAGTYLFSESQSAVRVAMRLIAGDEGFPMAKVTIPEGSDSADIARIVGKAMPLMATSTLLSLAKPHEGYLFPDTYFWPTNAYPERIVADMRTLFNDKIASEKTAIASSSRSVAQIVTMASIVEREGTSTDDRRKIAGILWKRLDAGMALQADASFYYVLGKDAGELTRDDLAINSPYNLYKNAGLPPTPIANPGLDALRDTIDPVKTKFWYYLAGDDGVTHYAETLEGHNANRAKYIK